MNFFFYFKTGFCLSAILAICLNLLSLFFIHKIQIFICYHVILNYPLWIFLITKYVIYEICLILVRVTLTFCCNILLQLLYSSLRSCLLYCEDPILLSQVYWDHPAYDSTTSLVLISIIWSWISIFSFCFLLLIMTK